MPDLLLQNLLSLSLSNNFLASVPPEIATNLTSLRTLNLANNDLSAVPIVTHSLEHLKRLSLAGNSIATLSNTSLLGAADRLEELDIRDLKINSFEVIMFFKGMVCDLSLG